MEDIKNLLGSVKRKAEMAAKRIEVLENENAALAAEVAKLKQRNDDFLKEIDDLKHSIDVLKVAKIVDSGDNNKGSKQKIAELVREIDNCIMLLK